jgi:FSR family fosmidomycin resistance protein-like MFS transporter
MASETAASPAATPIALPVRRGFQTLALLSVAHFFIDLYSSALSGFQPVLVERLGLSLAQAGVLGGLLVFSSSTVQPIYGYLSDRFHSRLFTALAPAVAGIFISLLGIAPNFLTLMALVLLGGVGIASFHPQGSARATLGITENRGRWMAVFISSGTLGLALGPSFFSWLITGLGIDRTWVGMIPGIAITGLLLAHMPEAPVPEGPRRAFDWDVLRAVWKPLTILYLLVFIRSVVQISFTQFLPLYLTKERALGLNQANFALTLYLGCGAIGGFLGGQLADRFGGRRVILISMIASVPLLGGFFFTTGLASLVCLGLGGLILLFTIPVNVTMGQDLAPSQAGTVSALMMGFAWGTAGMLFIPLVGLVADHMTLHWSLFSLLAFPILGFFLALKLPRHA